MTPPARRSALVALAGLTVALVTTGCGGVFGTKSTSTATFTPTMTYTSTSIPTPTLTPTPTATATPTATPTPALPDNPDGLQRWNDVPVTYCIVPGTGYVSDAVFVASVDRAFAAWGVPSINNGACDGIDNEDGTNEIGWGDLRTSASRGPGVYEAGLTSIRYRKCTSGCDPNDTVHLVEADITIDAAPPREFRSSRCLYSTLLHEAGHFLGLEHLPAPAVMATETSTCPAALTAADREALRERYGPVIRE